MLETIQSQDYAIDSVTVIRNGYLVLDASIHPYSTSEAHIIHSCTKSIVSALIGIAIAEGYLEDVHTPVLEIFPEREVANVDRQKEGMTLEHLLTMTTGFDCQDSYLYRWDGLNQMRSNEDWVGYVLDLPMIAPPGTRFEYCNGASFLLSAIISERTGMSAHEFANQHLFGPLGITDVTWPSNPQGINIGWGELRMPPHDMVKIGFLYLNNGEWDGEQVVPAEWVAASTRAYIPATLEDGYGYQWWITDLGYYLALGYAGQFIFVVLEEDMVVAFTSDLEERDFYTPQNLLDEYIIPAAISSGPLPANPEGAAKLQAAIDDLKNPK
jgi:CubicO group peptidase (beta-lactamase class C family)